MSKDNMFLGKARGKVGDLVFYVQDGIQMTRTRNRHPRNRNTEPQQFQRAVMATVSQVYRVGSSIFDHAFEGYSVGAQCQRKFLSINADMLRSGIASEAIDTSLAPEDCVYKVTGPKTPTPVPNRWIISQGSYDQKLFSTSGADASFKYVLPAVSGQETVAEYAARVGVIAGDIYTFCFITLDTSTTMFMVHGLYATDVDCVYRGMFGFVRLIAKNVSASTSSAAAAKFGDLFEVEFGGTGKSSIADELISADVNIVLLSQSGVASDGYSVGLIRSRRDVDLRSSSEMVVNNKELFGLYHADIVEAWSRGTTQLGNSELILEGGGV